MAAKIMDTLWDFIKSAERSRKYPPNTALGLRNALKLFETELNEEEAQSLDVFKDHLEQIYRGVFEKNKNRMSVGSIETYKTRVKRVLSDYGKYGLEPSKFASWSPTVKRVSTRKKKTEDTNSVVGPSVGVPADESLAPPRTLPSGVIVVFPKSLDKHVSFGEFGDVLKALDTKANNLKEDTNGQGEDES